ncbi:MAG: leucine-rich repeat protein [Rikenellaceae bacterium]
MGTTAEKLAAALVSKTAIKNAIVAKGVTVADSEPLSGYAAKIAAIEQSSGGDSSGDVVYLPEMVGSGSIEVRFVDPIYGVFLVYKVEEGDSIDIDDITPISHSGLTFVEWVKTAASLSSITHDIDVGAIYKPTSNKTEIDYTVSEYGGSILSVPLYSNDGAITINWGDGQTTTEAVNGIYSPANPIAQGSYTMSIECDGSAVFGTSSTMYIFGSKEYNAYITDVRLKYGQELSTYMFAYCRNMESLIFSSGTAQSYMLRECINLEHLLMPSTARYTNISQCLNCYKLGIVVSTYNSYYFGNTSFWNCYNLNKVVFPTSMYQLGTGVFQYNASMTNLKLHSSFTTLANGFINGSEVLAVLDLSTHTSVPTLAGTTAFSTAESFKILVPSALESSFKAATNWIVFADYIVGV